MSAPLSIYSFFHFLGDSRFSGLLLSRQPRHHATQLGADDLNRVLLFFLAKSGKIGAAVLVLGDPFFCEGGRTLLSSIDVNHRKIGFQAADIINRILDGETPPADAVLIPPAKVVTRFSTDPVNSATHPLVAKALKTIQQRAHDPEFNTEELAMICGVSSRTIGRLFEQHRLRSPYQFLLNVRVSTAQRLLQESELTADEIAYRCGFTDYSSFYRIFKNHMGISPSAFR